MSSQGYVINMKQVSDFDPAMRVQEDDLQNMRWISPHEKPLQLLGLGFQHENACFRRLPTNSKGDIPESVDHLANHSSGVQVRFRSNCKRIGIAVTLKNINVMVHMPATGQSGFDLYVKHEGNFLYYHTSKFNPKSPSYNLLMFEDPVATEREFILNFPLYEEVSTIHIGFDQEAEILAPSDLLTTQPIVAYGTSITQGGCATRPGMMCTNILSRTLPLEFINLGFSGSGKGEPALAQYIGEIQDPALIILDYEANTRGVGISKTMPRFVEILRACHPTTPILVISAPPNTKAPLKADVTAQAQEELTWQQTFVDQRRDNGDQHIHFLDGSSAIADIFQEATVDGTHPTDLGFQIMAKHWEPEIKRILNLS